MMMITRTETCIEFGLGESKAISIDVARITGAMLAAERAPCGRVLHSLLLLTDRGCDPVRIEGGLLELTEVHQLRRRDDALRRRPGRSERSGTADALIRKCRDRPRLSKFRERGFAPRHVADNAT